MPISEELEAKVQTVLTDALSGIAESIYTETQNDIAVGIPDTLLILVKPKHGISQAQIRNALECARTVLMPLFTPRTGDWLITVRRGEAGEIEDAESSRWT